MFYQRLEFKGAHRGQSFLINTVAVTFLTLGVGVLAVDLPTYFAVQNQLQTAVNAAAIAGAYELPYGKQEAEDAAYEVGSENLVGGKPLEEGDLTFNYQDGETMTMEVKGTKTVDTLLGKFLCAAASVGKAPEDEGGGDDGAGADANCNVMTVAAHAKATPAARDTILVIDTSSSMGEGNKPITSVKGAAKNFVTMIQNFNNQSVDRIGVVKFDQTAATEISLTAGKDYSGSGFQKVKDKITNLKLFSGSGWNTNYYVGLKKALDELEAKGRKNATKSIIFLTDGYPNLPAPTGYSQTTPYTKCTDKVNNWQAVKNLCYKKNGKTYCYYLPDDDGKITNKMISDSGGKACAQTYVDYMAQVANVQADRAKQMGVTIHTISIFDANVDSSSIGLIKRLLTNPNWDPQLLEYFANTTKGEQYASADADEGELNDIYQTIAADVQVKLSN